MPIRPLWPVLVAALLSTAACSEVGNGTGQISQRIGEVVRDPSAREVDLSKLTTFGWDEFYVFKAGTPRDEICDLIGARNAGCGRIVRYPAVPDDSVAIAFALRRHLTHIELHALENGRLEPNAGGRGYSRAAAVFKIRRASTGTAHDIVRLEP